MINKKKGVFFSADALIALGIILIVIIVAVPLFEFSNLRTNVHEDTLVVLSSLKIGEIDNSDVKEWITRRDITDTNKSIVEQIGEFYVQDPEKARTLAQIVLNETETVENIGIWYNGELLASKNKSAYENATKVDVARQTISGIGGLQEGSATGYSARAYLTPSFLTRYYYFGGYVGDGNITLLIKRGSASINRTDMELAINDNFDLYFNNQSLGNFDKSPSDFEPKEYTNIDTSRYYVPNPYYPNFGDISDGVIEIKGNKLHITGGFVKVRYKLLGRPLQTAYNKYFFPGVEGLINVYDGFYVPGNLTNLNINLHLNTNYTVFLNIGNKTVFNGTTDGIEWKPILNNTLSTMLNYTELSKKTIPIKLGLEDILVNASYGNSDIVLITDLSQTMNSTLDNDNNIGVRRNCDDPNLLSSDTARISLAQCLDKEFIDLVLNVLGNRIAIVGFLGDPGSPTKGRVNRTDFFMNDSIEVKRLIEQYNGSLDVDTPKDHYPPVGGGCICCALNSAYKILSEHSDKTTRRQYVLTMSDGLPIYRCATANNDFQGTLKGWPQNDAGPTASASGCDQDNFTASSDQCTKPLLGDDNKCKLAILNANWSACRLNNRFTGSGNEDNDDTNATVYSVGFGPVDQCAWANNTLNYVAQCGGGKYFSSSNPDDLLGIYQKIAREIIKTSYVEQTIFAPANVTARVYADSYIEYSYQSESSPAGQYITEQNQFYVAGKGNFSIPEKASIVEAKVVSYSGPKWTDEVYINNTKIYDLSNYGDYYPDLGDPYAVNIPNFYIGENNYINRINLTVGISPTNTSAGSIFDKIIYTFAKAFAGYSDVVSRIDGCVWNVEFEDNTTTIIGAGNHAEKCSYNSTLVSYNNADASQIAFYNLLKELDFNNNNKSDYKFTDEDLQISLDYTSGLPFVTNSEIQVRTWR